MVNVRDKVTELGGEIVPGPNALYASGFPTEEAVLEFILWLDENDFTHGSKIPMRDGTWDIRYSK